jgi:oligopeptide/dipeptide ABC transporter ATP-binding protein
MTTHSDAVAAAQTSKPPLLRADHLVKHFPLAHGLFDRGDAVVHAVDGVSFSLCAGETMALVGESGCGKSTLGRLLLRLLDATAGQVWFDGEDLMSLSADAMRARRRDLQMIFQDPYSSLNPRMTVAQTLTEPLSLHGLATGRRHERAAELLDLVGLSPHYLQRYPHEFSGGQRQRIGIARALGLEPRFIVCDEPVSALDVSIQSQILNVLSDLRDRFNLTYLFIAHNLSVVQYFCERIGVMYLGKLVEVAETDALYEHPRHPYSVALLSAIPVPDPRVRMKRLVLRGDVPSPANPPSGCRFHTRCWLREKLGNPEVCSTVDPPLHEVADGQLSACHFADQVSTEAARESAARQSVIETAAPLPE